MAQIVCPCEGAASTNTLHALYVTEYTAIACLEAEGPALKNAIIWSASVASTIQSYSGCTLVLDLGPVRHACLDDYRGASDT